MALTMFTFMPPGMVMSPGLVPAGQAPCQTAVIVVALGPFIAAMGAPVMTLFIDTL